MPRKAPFYIVGFILLIGSVLGRVVCGFLCPFGLIQELLHKIPTPKVSKSKFTRKLTWIKYLILTVFVIALPLWYAFAKGLPVPAFPKLVEKYGDDLALVTVNVGEDAETIQEFLDKNSYSDLTVFLDEDYAISDLYPSDGIPYTIIIDREGVISATQLGAVDADTMLDKYSSLIDAVL